MTELTILDTYSTPGRGPAGLAWDGRSLWNADYAEGQIFQIDPATGKATGALTCPGNLSGLAWDGRSLWQAIHDEGWLRCVNPHTNDFDRTLVVEDHGWLSGAAWDGQQFWAVSQQKGHILALDRDSGQAFRTIPAPIAGGGLDHRAGSLWLGIAYPMHFNERFQQFEWQGEERHFAIVQLDTADGREIARYSLDFLPLGLAWVNDELWLTQAKERKLYRTRLGPMAG